MPRDDRRLGLSASETGSKPSVLLLDDDEKDLTLFEQILRSDGFQVLKTTDPARAFELLASDPVGIVISDQNMPGITGVEFLSQVRKLYPDVIRILFTSAYDPKAIADAVNAAAIHKLMMKDWDRERLRAAVREVFHGYRPKDATPPPSVN